MTDRITLRYDGIQETIECYEIIEGETSVTLCGLPTDDMDYGITTIGSEILIEAPGGRRGEYRGVSQSMADPRGEYEEQFPKIRIGNDSDIEIVSIETDVDTS